MSVADLVYGHHIIIEPYSKGDLNNEMKILQYEWTFIFKIRKNGVIQILKLLELYC